MAPDRGLVAAKLAVLEEAVRFLEEMAALSYEQFTADRRNLRTSERYLHLACEATFDIGTHLIASLGLPRPERYADIVPILRNAGISTAETAEALTDLAGFRNLLVHDYARVDHRRLHAFCQTRLGDFRRFAAEIAAALDRSEASPPRDTPLR